MTAFTKLVIQYTDLSKESSSLKHHLVWATYAKDGFLAAFTGSFPQKYGGEHDPGQGARRPQSFEP